MYPTKCPTKRSLNEYYCCHTYVVYFTSFTTYYLNTHTNCTVVASLSESKSNNSPLPVTFKNQVFARSNSDDFEESGGRGAEREEKPLEPFENVDFHTLLKDPLGLRLFRR